MKVIMNSKDRVLYGVVIKQKTENGFLSVSDLNRAYEKARELHGWGERHYQHLIAQKENIERVYYILEELKITNCGIQQFVKSCETDGVLKVLKGLGVYKTTGRWEDKETWCHPYLWVLIAMELNPQIYAKVSIWVADNLILNRIEAGRMYRGLTDAISKFNGVNPNYYATVAMALNHKIFGRHETGIRNTATQDELKDLENLEIKIAFACEAGFVNTCNECIELINKTTTKRRIA